MRITESQLRRIIRRAIKENSARRGMNEGWFDSVRDFFTGKKGDEKDGVKAAEKKRMSYVWSDAKGVTEFANKIADLWEMLMVTKGVDFSKPLSGDPGQPVAYKGVFLKDICNGDEATMTQIRDNAKKLRIDRDLLEKQLYSPNKRSRDNLINQPAADFIARDITEPR